MISFFSNFFTYHFGTTKAVVILFLVSIFLLPITYFTSLYYGYSIPPDTIYSHATFIVFEIFFDCIIIFVYIGVYYHLAKSFDQSLTKFRVKSVISSILLAQILFSLVFLVKDIFYTPVSMRNGAYMSFACLLIPLLITFMFVKHFWKSVLCAFTPLLLSLLIGFNIYTFLPFLLNDLPITIAETYYSQGNYNNSAAILEKYIVHYDGDCSKCKELLDKCYKELGIHSID